MSDTFLNKYPVIAILAGLAVLSIPFGRYASLLAILIVMVIQYFYYLFYTKRPKIFYPFAIAGIILYVLNWKFPSTIIIAFFASIAGLECLRVILMAILRYPQTIEDLQGLTEELENRVDERTAELQKTNEKLHKANDELRVLDEMKTAFVSQASHDLRTPLAAIKGSLDNLNLGVAGELNEKQARILGRATRSVDRLTDLINDVLDLSRIESGRIALQKTDIPFNVLIESIVAENKPAADLKSITLLRNLSNETITVNADGGKIERVVGELLSNAIKYTPENGTVEVALIQNGDRANLSVKDSGIGMTEEECEKIWERFYRTNASKNFAKGSGLGLSIAKELVELHDGTLSVQSEQEQGTTFTLALPFHSN